MADFRMPSMLMPNYVSSALDGYERGHARGQEQRFGTLAKLAKGGQGDVRRNALADMAGINPERAQRFGGALQEEDDDFAQKAVAAAASVVDQYKAGNIEAAKAAYRYALPALQRVAQAHGKDAPPEFDESHLAGLEAMAGIRAEQQRNVAVAPGSAIVDPRTGKVVYERPFAPANMQFLQADDGYVAADPRTGAARPLEYGGQQPPQINYQTDDGQPIPQEDHAALQAAIAASARGEEFNIPVGGAAAAIESRRVRPPEKKDDGPAPPSGFRWTAGGGLEPIQGGPADPATKTQSKGVPSEGERKAATLLQRLEGSLKQMNTAITEKPSAASPNLRAAAARGLPFVGEIVSNSINPQERQRVEAAQLDILDAALTLGTGAAYTKEQLEGYRKSFFPQIGDSKETISDKQARLDNVIKSARIAAGRAVQSGPSEDQPRKVNSAADYNALPSGATYIAPDGTQRRKK